MSWLLTLAFLAPLTLAMLLSVDVWRRPLLALLPWSAAPALLAALLLPDGATLHWPQILFGTHLALDPLARGFLLPSAILWLLAGHFARGWLQGDAFTPGFQLCWLLAMAGNFGLLIAADAISFYLFFALMSIAAWGLVIQERSARALHAGRVYMVQALLGEALLLGGVLLAVHTAGGTVLLAELPAALNGTEHGISAIWLLLAGFGVKAGILPLHAWLPLAHPAAPVPASAVLSGAMIKAGLFGWLRFLPLGVAAIPDAGLTLLVLGLAGVFLGVIYGLAQRDPKALLAYSSISQMGILASACGLALWQPRLFPVLLPAIMLYALHHALAKGSLFLGVGMVIRFGPSAPVLAGVGLAALSLAGAPFSAGALAKASLKAGLPGELAWLGGLLAVGAVGTTLLMLRFVQLLRQKPNPAPVPGRGLWFAWLILLLASLGGPWLAARWLWGMDLTSGLWPALWPLLSGLLLAGALRHRDLPDWPAGDLAAWCVSGLRVLRRPVPRLPVPKLPWRRLGEWLDRLRRRATTRDMQDTSAGVALLIVAGVLYLAV